MSEKPPVIVAVYCPHGHMVVALPEWVIEFQASWCVLCCHVLEESTP